jgi:hypothetical protein
VPGHLQRSGLGCGPLDRLLVENSAAVSTDLLLDLVRDAGTLQEHMNTLGNVLVDHGWVLCAHFVLRLRVVTCSADDTTERVKILQTLCDRLDG